MTAEERGLVLDRVLLMALKSLRAVRAATETTKSGLTARKGRQQRAVEKATFDAMVQVLDSGFRWWGPWGRTRAGIELELLRRVRGEELKLEGREG